MTPVQIVKVETADPADTAGPLAALAKAGFGPEDVLAVVGKTEGNGCVNDFSRGLAATVWEPLIPEDAVTVFSGGTEGVLCPHVTLLVADERPEPGAAPTGAGLVAAAARTPIIPPEQLGRTGQLDAVRQVVDALLATLALAPEDVHLVLVKCPLLTSERVAAARERGVEPVTEDTYESMGRSRLASALGVALALGECTEAEATAGLTGHSVVWSDRASASAGAELTDCHVLVLGTSAAADNRLRAVHASMRDAIDAQTVLDLLAAVRAQGGTVRQVLAKAEAAPDGRIRGRRHTMLTDSDLPATRHARAAAGGLLAGLVGDTAIYVSGGAEGQGPPGGGNLTVLYELPAR
jgi:cyanuric acid amidohydrolase